MKPTIVLGDIHSLPVWKEIAEHNPDYRYIFLGDYLDPPEKIDRDTLINNLREIIRFKKDNFDNATLLLGNHDLHYFTDDICPSAGFDFGVLEIASILFSENFRCFQYALQVEKFIFTHAGISQKWFLDDFKGTLDRNIAEQLNHPTDAQIKALCKVSEHFGGGNGEAGGIFSPTGKICTSRCMVSHKLWDITKRTKFRNINRDTAISFFVMPYGTDNI
jgi:hypothetical protein